VNEGSAVISYLEGLPRELAEEFVQELDGSGLRVSHESRPPEPQAGIEWLLPTAVVLFFVQNYLGVFLQKAAEDHYELLKSAIMRLVRRTTGASREIRLTYHASGPNKISADPATFSIYVRTDSGATVKFIFEHSTPDEAVPDQVEGFLRIVARLESPLPPGADLNALAWARKDSGLPIVLRFNHDAGRWVISFPEEI
jgi:hypothetical protein